MGKREKLPLSHTAIQKLGGARQLLRAAGEAPLSRASPELVVGAAAGQERASPPGPARAPVAYQTPWRSFPMDASLCLSLRSSVYSGRRISLHDTAPPLVFATLDPCPDYSL